MIVEPWKIIHTLAHNSYASTLGPAVYEDFQIDRDENSSSSRCPILDQSRETKYMAMQRVHSDIICVPQDDPLRNP